MARQARGQHERRRAGLAGRAATRNHTMVARATYPVSLDS
eukprot:COSAG05_NODE_19594_length_290_cov_0.879581_1_plen_39_part_10